MIEDNDNHEEEIILSKLTEEQCSELAELAQEHYDMSLYEVIGITRAQGRLGDYNWNLFLQQPEEDKNWIIATFLAADWCTCATKQFAMARDEDYTPLNSQMKELGVEFYNAILARDVEQGKRIIKQMLKRFVRMLAQNN